MGFEPFRQGAHVGRVQTPASRERVDVLAVLRRVLRPRRRVGRVVASRLPDNDLVAIDIGGDGALRGQCAGVVYRCVDVLAFAGCSPVDQRGHDRHVSIVGAGVPGIAASGRDGRCVGNVAVVVTAGSHLAARRHVQQVARLVVPPRSGLAERRQGTHDQFRVGGAQRLVSEIQGRQAPGPRMSPGPRPRRCQAQEQTSALVRFDVERDAALGGV